MGVRVFLLDDHELVRRGLAELLAAHEDLELVGEADSIERALARIPALRPDVAVLDVRLPDGSGVEACRRIRSAHPEVQCLMLTSYADEDALSAAAAAGAAGFVLKDIRGNELAESIRRVHCGEVLLDPATCAREVERLHRSSHDDELGVDSLTPREQRILALIGEGRTNRQIADELHLAEKTVKNYVSNLLSKLNMSRRTEAAALAARMDERRRRHGSS